MALPNASKGGAFKGASTKQNFDHGNAMQMAHAAHRKMAVAAALSAPKEAPVAAPGGPPEAGSFKAHVAHRAHAKGAPASLQHVHNAIDSLTKKGAFTPAQGLALKNHNGPLQGPAGQKTVDLISDELVKNPKVRS